jgi:hypothetical protein
VQDVDEGLELGERVGDCIITAVLDEQVCFFYDWIEQYLLFCRLWFFLLDLLLLLLLGVLLDVGLHSHFHFLRHAGQHLLLRQRQSLPLELDLHQTIAYLRHFCLQIGVGERVP